MTDDTKTPYTEEVDTIAQFGPSFQSKVIISLIKKPEFLSQTVDILNPNFFEAPSSKWIIGKVIEYFINYKKPPTLDYFRSEVNALNDREAFKVSVVEQLKSAHAHFTDSDLEYVQEKFLDFAKNQTLKNAILESAELLQRGQLDGIKVLIDKAMKAGIPKDPGLNWNEEFDARHLENARSTLATGWGPLNNVLDGGLGPGELGVIAAPSGIGKSWLLTHIGMNAIKQGKKVVHYSYELNQNYQGIRYDTCFSGIEPSKLKNNLDHVRNIVSNVSGGLVIKYFPGRTANAHTLSAHVDLLQMMDFDPDLMIIDYADLMKATVRSDARYQELGYIYEELRSMCGEMEIPMWTASQTQRSSINDDVIEADKIAESYDKVKTCDVLLSVSRKTEDKINNTARAHLIKNRFGPDGITFPMKMDTATGQIEMYDGNSPDGAAIQATMANGEDEMKKRLKSYLD